ncbi:unnamed protein product [Rotaria magnacalcarata]|uniref:Uncharacterized protein n=1 Tax=Rotaria magnacalcarata TaxID=392030 RepID=A0A820WCG7_9BILA|nr:unnamed protein product [Rotaria magnacalcarata]
MPDKGFKNDMKTLPIICSFCPWNDLFKDYEEHLKIKHPNPICEFCEERFNSTIKLAEHKQKECTKITVPCPLKEFGCSEPGFFLVGLPKIDCQDTDSLSKWNTTIIIVI